MSKTWNSRTRAVHGGIRRSQYGEVSEAIFLTQGFVYDSAEAAEARFIESGDDEFIYARYGNPTVKMFEERIASLEGAEDAFATASGMAAVSGALTAMLKAGDHVVSAKALFGSCLYVAELIMWSIACMPKFHVMNSTIGFKPLKAEPTAIPAKPCSVIGVSITRFSPNSSNRPCDTLYAP